MLCINKRILYAVALCTALVSAAQTVTVNGSVKNLQGKPIPGAAVKLLNADLITGTDISGNFKFASSGATNTSSPLRSFIHNQSALQVNKGTLALNTAEALSNVTVQVHSLAGRLIQKTHYNQLGAGQHNLLVYNASGIAQTALIVSINTNGLLQSLIVPFSAEGFSSKLKPVSHKVASNLSAAAAVDSLLVTIDGKSKTVSLDHYQQSGISITLDYAIPVIAELPSKSMSEQKSAKEFFLGLDNASNTFVGFKHQDNDPNKDIIGIVVATQNDGSGVLTDNHMNRLKDFPKLKAFWVQNQKLSDKGLEVLKEFPHLEDVRFHYMKNSGSATGNFLEPIRQLKKLRVLEVKHCFSLEDIKINNLDGFPLLERLILDNGASNDQGVEFAMKCPSLIDFHYHRGKITQPVFEKFIRAFPGLKFLWVRSDINVPANHLEVLRNHPSLEIIRLDAKQDAMCDSDANFLMPLATIPTLKQLCNAGTEEPRSAAVVKLLAERKDIEDQFWVCGHVDRGYVFPPYTDLNANNRGDLENDLK